MSVLLDCRLHGGSRQFAELRATRDWYAVRDHVEKLDGAKLTSFLCDDITEAWIDFTYMNHSFTINDQFGDYWFSVSNPECPDHILTIVMNHWEHLLCPSPA